MSDHEVVVQRISDALSGRGFYVQIRGNNLPKGSRRTEAIYRPDLIVRSKQDQDIIWLVEVETSQAGKSVVGAMMLADICMEEEIKRGRQREKPGIMFIFYRESANLQLAEKRLEALRRRRRVSHLAKILVLDETTALKKSSNLPSEITKHDLLRRAKRAGMNCVCAHQGIHSDTGNIVSVTLTVLRVTLVLLWKLLQACYRCYFSSTTVTAPMK